MADDTLDIRETLPFEATTRPYGTFYNYDMEALSQDQQEYVNRVKLCVLREQHRYLSRHPEVFQYLPFHDLVQIKKNQLRLNTPLDA